MVVLKPTARGRRLLLALLLLMSVPHPAIAGAGGSPAAAVEGLSPDYLASLERFRDNADFRFRDRILSPLTEAQRLSFGGLRYFEAAPELVLAAGFQAADDRSAFAMPTFNRKTLSYSHYGTLSVRLQGEVVRLKAFRRLPGYNVPDMLLVPFRDATNGEETYPGGRYIELALPLPPTPVLDFNRAMNPLCAYDPSYACPIPPPENRLTLPVRAGEKRYR